MSIDMNTYIYIDIYRDILMYVRGCVGIDAWRLKREGRPLSSSLRFFPLHLKETVFLLLFLLFPWWLLETKKERKRSISHQANPSFILSLRIGRREQKRSLSDQVERREKEDKEERKEAMLLRSLFFLSFCLSQPMASSS